MSIMTDSPIRFPGLFGDWAFTASSTAFHIGGKPSTGTVSSLHWGCWRRWPSA